MLSKLRYQAPDRDESLTELTSVVKAAFLKNGVSPTVTPLQGAGTLGLCYLLQKDGEQLFVKTHLPGRTHQMALIKEAVLLQKLYEDALLREVVSVEAQDGNHTLLVMEELAPLQAAPSAEVMADIIASYGDVFSVFLKEETKLISPAMPDIGEVWDEAEEALHSFAEEGLLQPDTAEHCAALLATLREADDGRRILCHGDLSNKNLLQKKGQLFVIDWEDALWGVPGYDFYYWLTFFDQRGLYTKEAFAALPVPHTHGVAMMVAVVLVKCALSQRDGSARGHKLSFEQRIGEILALEA